MLAVRNCRWYLRNPELMLAKLFTYIFMGAFMGAPLLMLLFSGRMPPGSTSMLEALPGLLCDVWQGSILCCASCGAEF